MTNELLSKVLCNVQSLGPKEDILTGVLATAFQVSRNFTEKFFNEMLRRSHAKAEDYFSEFPHEYGVAIGEKVSKKRYAWIEDKRIAFAPDIWIFDQTGEEWQEIKPKPKPSFHFLIECKEAAKVTKGQLRGYPFFEDDLFGKMEPRIFTLLIANAATEEETKQFSYSISWPQLSSIFAELSASLGDDSEAIQLRWIKDLIDFHLTLKLTELLRADIRVDEAALRLLEWVRSRVPSDGSIRPRVKEAKIGLRTIRGKRLCLNSDQKTQLWLYAERKSGAFQLSIEKWLDQAQVGRSSKIALDTDPTPEDWNRLLQEIREEQQAFIDELT